MSDSNIPPDDFSATTPNIKVPKKDSPNTGSSSASDWEKTNYNYSPKDLGKEDWNKTAFNAPKSPQPPPDFNKTNYSAQSPKDGDWGMTQANIDLPGNRSNQYDNPIYEDYGSKQSDYDKTSLAINLPRNEEPKYQEPSKNEEPKYQEPFKKEKTVEAKEEKKGGVPGWLWASAGLLGMFLFATVVLLGVYFFFLGKSDFEVIVRNVPAGSDVMIDNSYWGVTDSDGSIWLKTLRVGQTRTIQIKNPAWKCEDIVIPGEKTKNLKEPYPETARCTATGGNTGPNINTGPIDVPKECLEIKSGDFQTSRNCAYNKLNEIENDEKAGKKLSDEEYLLRLLKALNLYLVFFDKNKYQIKPVDMDFITRASVFLKRVPAGTRIEVGGHTDSDGSDALNQPLSEKRAKAVRDALIQKGVPPGMLTFKGYGSKFPKDNNTNANEDEKFRNRRIEYKIIS